MLIGELAASLGVDPKTIRYYEAIGVLPAPARSAVGYRLYGRADHDRLRFVKAARSLGFSLGEIKEILRLRDRGKTPCAYVSEVIDRRVDDIDQAIDELTRLKAELVRLRRRARRAPIRRSARDGVCHLIEAS